MEPYKFEYNFWRLNPLILNAGEKQFQLLAKHFDISLDKLSDIEDTAKDDVLTAIVNVANKGENPFKHNKEFLLSNLINQYKLDQLVNYICKTKNEKPENFTYDAIQDGAYVKVLYKENPIEK